MQIDNKKTPQKLLETIMTIKALPKNYASLTMSSTKR